MDYRYVVDMMLFDMDLIHCCDSNCVDMMFDS